MISKRTIIITLSLILLCACSSTKHVDQKQERETSKSGIAYFPLESKLELENGKFIFTIKNQNDRPEKLEFSSALEYDYKVIRQGGEILKQRSKNMMFAQRLKTVTLKQAQELVYEEDYSKVIEGLPKGSYTVEFSSTAKGKQIRSTLNIDVQ